MNVARTTVQAVYNTAREKIGRAGKRPPPVITGGSYDVCGNSSCCGKNCVAATARTEAAGKVPVQKTPLIMK
jgi:hypothetical protein